MSELEQAKKILAQAESVLEQSTQNLEKSQTFNELMVEQNRRLSFALSNLLPKQYVASFSISEGKQFTELAKAMKSGSFEVIAEELAENFKQREAFDIVHAINVLAMANTDVLHVFTEFRAQYNMFEVQVYSLGNEARNALLMAEVDMTAANTLQGLLSIESKVTELIIEAREKAEARAEVEA